jgi:hypothetical protein
MGLLITPKNVLKLTYLMQSTGEELLKRQITIFGG